MALCLRDQHKQRGSLSGEWDIFEGLGVEGMWNFSRQNINISESPECKLLELEPSGVGKDGDTEPGQISLGVSTPTTCFLEVKSGYEEHQGSLKTKSQEDRLQTWGHACCVLIGGGGMGESRPTYLAFSDGILGH